MSHSSRNVESAVREVELLAEMIDRSNRATVLTGAGCSTESGIPDYRGPNGTWHKRRPMNYSEFVRSADSRRYFWARNYKAWPRFSSSSPNRAHLSLADLERQGHIAQLVTQNVDDLHRRAGSRNVIDLHGRSAEVVCIGCGVVSSRSDLQARLQQLNARWDAAVKGINADGDVEIEREETRDFVVPDCESCGGVLKPNVVFFGESVPRGVVDRVTDEVRSSDLLLVIGSSLTVWSGYRFALTASDCQVPIAIVNIGPTRADDLAALKVEASCGAVMERIAAKLS